MLLHIQSSTAHGTALPSPLPAPKDAPVTRGQCWVERLGSDPPRPSLRPALVRAAPKGIWAVPGGSGHWAAVVAFSWKMNMPSLWLFFSFFKQPRHRGPGSSSEEGL